MAYNRPSIQTLMQRWRSASETALDSSFGWLRRGLLPALGKGHVGLTHGLHGHIEYVSDQIVPGFATDTKVIDRQALFFLRSGRKAAHPASGRIVITGTDGKVLVAGSVLTRGSFEYVTQADATISSGTSTVTVECTTGGIETNADAGVTLSIAESISGISSTATVDIDGLSGGTETESNDALNARILNRLRLSPNGSNADQYVVWALEVPGVTRAWCMPNWLGPGTVGLFFVRDDDASIIPSATEVQAVQDYIDPIRPAGMIGFTAISPTPVYQDFTIKLSPNTAVVQSAVETAITDLIYKEGAAEDGNGTGTLLISHVNEAISSATGEKDHQIVSPSENVELNKGELVLPGTFTWDSL